jgi:hypothetical protein
MELIIEGDSKLYYPVVQEGIKWTTERKGTPGKLTFKLIQDDLLEISEGNAVALKDDDGNNVFYGFIFTIKRDESSSVSVTAYDQTRYLKNKATYQYTKTASDLLKMIAKDFELNVGEIADTGYLIPSRLEDGNTLFDIMQTALDLTLENTGELYVLYDDYGKLQISAIEDMMVGILIDADTAQKYDYESSIDSNTYNQIKLYYDNDSTGKRDVYLVKDSEHINEWGLLQYYESIQKGENGKSKADALLKLYNAKTKSLKVKNAIGDSRVRAGTMIAVQLNLGDITINNWMLVETAEHEYKENEHWMDLKLRGGDINNA